MPGWSVGVILLAFLAAVAGVTWWIMDELHDVQLSQHGWWALIAGGVGTLVLTVVLMGLVYFSARRGYDDAAGRDD